jgi:hypothetical protein
MNRTEISTNREPDAVGMRLKGAIARRAIAPVGVAPDLAFIEGRVRPTVPSSAI